jgi:hypothetical protein
LIHAENVEVSLEKKRRQRAGIFKETMNFKLDKERFFFTGLLISAASVACNFLENSQRI